MIRDEGIADRTLKRIALTTDLAIVGGGLAGTCAAITAARAGLSVVLVQDRPVLGGNASSEVRLWVLGATSHMGNNNRWAREGGVVDEILVENMFRNPEGNAVIFDTVLLDNVMQEKNITLLLNTCVFSLQKSAADTIEAVIGFCSQNATEYLVTAPIFCDASGDGILGFLSGAAFRMGAESQDEFNELFAPSKAYGELLGHSIYFYSKDTGKPVTFVPPSFALENIEKIPRYKNFNASEFGCKLWWIEYGGRLDTVHDTETIKWELWKVVYGVWNYIKNSGKFPEAETYTLEWVGTIPGKRESRRFEGDYMLTQQDIVEQRKHQDAVAFGGWSIDLHPADGVFSEKPRCNQWHSKGIYQIPYRCLYSRNISNLFLAGRVISASHVAFGSTRVMATSAYVAQAAAAAAVLCIKKELLPRQILQYGHISELQTALITNGHHIPLVAAHDETDLAQQATVTASSALCLKELKSTTLSKPLTTSACQMLPLKKGALPTIELTVDATLPTILEVELRISSKPINFTPDIIAERKRIDIQAGQNSIAIVFDYQLPQDCYVFVTLLKNEAVSVYYSNQRITGILSVFNQINKSVSNYGKQEPPENIGVDAFEFWCPQRRPEGQNIALKISNGIDAFGPKNILSGTDRPTTQPNAWVADWQDTAPEIQLEWDTVQKIQQIVISFDTDFDHPMESVLMSHPERQMPFCVTDYILKDDKNNIVKTVTGNYQTINKINLTEPISTKRLTLQVQHPSATVPAAVFAVRCYAQ
jgi:hypothetical protein